MTKPNNDIIKFSKTPHWIINDLIFAKMSFTASKVYIVIQSFADFRTREAIIGVKKIVKFSGIGKDSVRLAIKELMSLGVIGVKRGGPRVKFTNIYTVYLDNNPKRVVSRVVGSISRKKHRIRKVNKDPLTGKFISSREKTVKSNSTNEQEKTVLNPREKTVSDISRGNNGNNKSVEIIKNRDTAAGSALACQGQAKPAFPIECLIGHTIETKSELDYYIDRYGKETISALIREGKAKVFDGLKIDG